MLSECLLGDPEKTLAFYPGKELFARAKLDFKRDAGELDGRAGEGRLGRERESESAVGEGAAQRHRGALREARRRHRARA